MSIIEDTYALATPLGRLPGTAGHRNAARYITRRFAEIGLEPYSGDDFILPYIAEVHEGYGHQRSPINLTMKNIVGVVPGADRGLPPVLLGAHFDSVLDSHCADDNATAVAAMLHAARQLADSPLERDVVIAAFDAEEPPFFLSAAMGSTAFVEDHLRGVHLAIIMDLIGHPAPVGGVDPHLTAITGIESHPGLAGVLDGSSLPVIAARNSQVGDMSDHHAFRLAGHPFLFLSSGEWQDYHTYDDTPDKIDYSKVAAVAAEIERLARYADGVQLGPARSHDISALEWSTAVAHLGQGMVDALIEQSGSIVPALRQAMRRSPVAA